MFTKIVVPVDGSETSLHAINTAVEVAKAFKSEVHLVCVVDSYPFTGVGADFAYGQVEYLAAARTNAEDALKKAEDKFDGITPIKHIVEQHIIYEGILDVAKEVGADLVIISSHGRKGLEKLLLGSETTRVLQHADIPVLVVRPTNN